MKGELSLNIVVMAVIVLIILVVLSFLVFRQSGNLSEGLNSCSGMCVLNSVECKPDYDLAVPMGCETPRGETGNYCCQNI